MYRHDRLDTMVEWVIIEAVLNIYRDQSCLPVMAVDDIRTEIQRRHCRQCCFTEKCKLLNILENIAIWMKSCEIELIIDKIEGDPFIYIFKNSDITALSQVIHIKMIYISKIAQKFILDTEILRDHDPHIKIFFIKTFR